MPPLKSFYHHVVYRLKGVQVMALVGKAGTGKSFRAQLIAKKQGVDLIIDDGLVIRDQKILAGQSAKQASGGYTAIKTALFHEPHHRNAVRSRLAHETFKRVLILGTSDRMVVKIASRLDLPAPSKITNIEEVASQREIDRALRSRQGEGKHVIPVPAVEVRRSHSHIFFNSIRIFFSRRLRRTDVFEKSVVRPVYSKKGRITISEDALTQMIFHCVNEYAPALQVTRITYQDTGTSYRAEVHLTVPYGFQISGLIHNLQTYVIESIDGYTGIHMDRVSLTVDSVSNAHRPE